MSEKSFVTCFDRDKDLEKVAEFLMALVSDDDKIRNINTSREEFKKDRKVTSDEYVLAIGEKSSANYSENFPDKYNQYGIHIGFRGAKAWIGVENFDWDEGSLSRFHQELLSLSEEMNLDLKDKPIKEYLKTIKDNQKNIGKSDNEVATKLHTDALDIIMTVLAVTNAQLNPIHKYLLSVHKWFRDLFKNSERRKLQYKLAVIMFVHKYIHEFLKIDDQENTEQNF